MKILRQYQLEIVFLFVLLLSFLWVYFLLLQYFGADPHDYEWFVGLPVIGFYLVFHLKKRDSISLSDRRALTAKSLVYWIILGITMFVSYATPIPAKDYWSINVLFILFTLFLADSYWDFKNITLQCLKDKKELR